MVFISFFIFILELINYVTGSSCYYLYYRCSGYSWCCPDGYICTGSPTCLSIAAIVGGCIGALVGLGLFIAFIYFVCFRKNRATTGRVIQPQTVGTTQQYAQPVVTYTQPPNYGMVTYPPSQQQQQNGQMAYPPPPQPQLQSDNQPAYPPPPPPSLYK